MSDRRAAFRAAVNRLLLAHSRKLSVLAWCIGVPWLAMFYKFDQKTVLEEHSFMAGYSRHKLNSDREISEMRIQMRSVFLQSEEFTLFENVCGKGAVGDDDVVFSCDPSTTSVASLTEDVARRQVMASFWGDSRLTSDVNVQPSKAFFYSSIDHPNPRHQWLYDNETHNLVCPASGEKAPTPASRWLCSQLSVGRPPSHHPIAKHLFSLLQLNTTSSPSEHELIEVWEPSQRFGLIEDHFSTVNPYSL
eukprot:GHVN01020628.1.p1 GENE.GHVN01020628.1~~GHVN01020628.1.p1  ORF type:complete len:248 (+),score=24.33 GHVN01020628.1:140-883(+)